MITKGEQLSIPPDGRAEAEQPRWRQDFPIDWPQDHYVARRDFTKFMVLTSFAFMVGQFWIVVQNLLRRRRGEPPLREITAVSQIGVGQSHPFTYPAAHDSCVLVRTGEETFVAFSQKCTHLSCAVIPEPQNNRFYCPCHEGSFDLASGRAVAGPPRRPLDRIKLEFRNGRIYAAGVEARVI